MLKRRNLARIGGVIATLSLLVLPLASCGTAELSGTDLLFEVEDNWGHRVIFFIALAAGILANVFMTRAAHVGLGAAGLLMIVIEYAFSIGDPENTVRLLPGAYAAALGFGMVLAAGLMKGEDTG